MSSASPTLLPLLFQVTIIWCLAFLDNFPFDVLCFVQTAETPQSLLLGSKLMFHKKFLNCIFLKEHVNEARREFNAIKFNIYVLKGCL